VSDHQARQKTQSEDAINLASVTGNIVRTTEASGSFCFIGGSMDRAWDNM
jgi:acetyl-CoA carboxylase beta subunit